MSAIAKEITAKKSQQGRTTIHEAVRKRPEN